MDHSWIKEKSIGSSNLRSSSLSSSDCFSWRIVDAPLMARFFAQQKDPKDLGKILYKSTNQEVLSVSNPMEQSTKERRLGKKNDGLGE